MNLIKKLLAFAILGVAFTLQAAEPKQENRLDKVFFYFSRITNHTNKDLRIEDWFKGLGTVKAGETKKNIPLYRDSWVHGLMFRNQQYKRLGNLRIDYSLKEVLNLDSDAVSIKFSTKLFETTDKWEEKINLDSYKRIGFGINLDLKGDDLSQSELDVVAEAQ